MLFLCLQKRRDEDEQAQYQAHSEEIQQDEERVENGQSCPDCHHVVCHLLVSLFSCCPNSICWVIRNARTHIHMHNAVLNFRLETITSRKVILKSKTLFLSS